MAVQCDQCGAPLHPEEKQTYIRCDYCGSTMELAGSSSTSHDEDTPANLQSLASARAQSRTGPPPLTPSQPTVSYGEKKKGKRGLLVGIGGALIVALVGAGVYVAVRGVKGAMRDFKKLAQTVTGSGLELWNPTKSCVVDANGDGIDDVAGLGGDSPHSYRPAIVDGKTGDIIWKGDPYDGSGRRVGCLSEDWFLITGPQFRVDIFKARKPQAPVKVMLRDGLRAMGIGDGCVSLKSQDGKTNGFAIPGGTSQECEVSAMHPIYEPGTGLVKSTKDKHSVTKDGVTYTLTKRKRGTPMLAVTAKKGDRTLWSEKLDYRGMSGSTGFAVGGGMVMLWAAKPGKWTKGILVGLDAKTGKQKYERHAKGPASHVVGIFHYNGKYLVVGWWTGLRAFSPKNGDIVWEVGR